MCANTTLCKQPSAKSSVSRHLHTRIAARVCETSGRAAENRATLEPTKHVAKQSSWSQIPLGALSGLVCSAQHNICKQPSANPVSHGTCTRELPPEFAETSGRAAENREQHWSQRSTLRNSLPGVGFRWGHCQVLFVSQHNICKQPSANPVSHDTCTRELPPEFVKRAAEQLKIEQHWSQRSTLRNSLPGVRFRWGHCQVLFVSQHNICKQPSANPVSHDTCTRELPPEFVKRAASSS